MSTEQMVGTTNIWFNEKQHTYVNDLGEKYTSVTTLIGEYTPKFDTVKMAKAVARKGEGIYKGMTYKQVLTYWDKIRDDACEQGTAEHNVLETAVKTASGITIDRRNYTQLFTIDDLLLRKDYEVDISIIEKNTYARHAVISNTISYLLDKGYIPFAEVCVYDPKLRISGMIDLLFINFTTNEFILGDYKTNKAPIRYEAGYFKKDSQGNLTDNFIESGERCYYPIEHLACSVGNKYALQLSMYSKQVELRGLKLKGNILFHLMRKPEYTSCPITNDNTDVIVHSVPYLSNEIDAIFNKRFSEVSNIFNPPL